MQIREQGRQVQLIRSPYDPEKKRCIQKVAHTFKQQYQYLSADLKEYLSDEQIADLSDNEKAKLSDWLKTKADRISADDRKSKISYSDRYISLVADAISSDGLDSAQALKIWLSIEKLSKVLKKSGHPRSAAKGVQVSPAPADQAGLDL
jgi:hypothetical protein